MYESGSSAESDAVWCNCKLIFVETMVRADLRIIAAEC